MSAPTGSGRHAAFAEDAGAYVLGALTDTENEDFRAHLRECPECREEVARLQVVADALPLASPQLRASEELKGRIMGALGGESAARAPARAARGRRSASARRGPGRRWTFVAVPALAAVAVVLAVVAIAQSGGGGATRVVRAQVAARGASASLRIRDDRGQLQINGMPQVPAHDTYEVWVQRGASPQPTDSLFTVSSAGTATVGVPGSLAGVKAVLVTAEPLGGTRVPTTSPILIAHVS